MKQIVLASNNAKKRQELFDLLRPHLPDVTVRTMAEVGVESPPEDADSFHGNALIKARHCAAHTGLAAIADDSGLHVDVLDGAPGVYSARYAGDMATDAENNQKLIDTLRAVHAGPFPAAFHAAVVFITDTGDEHVANGTMPGVVKLERRGTHGFGYDPLFYPDAYQHARSNAELSAAEKQAISHRGEALRRLLPAIIDWAAQTG